MFENLQIERLVLHEVLTAEDIHKRKPLNGKVITAIDNKVKDLIGSRQVDAIGSSSHCEDMIVKDTEKESAFRLVADLFDASNSNFQKITSSLAEKLSKAQTGGSVKEGIGVFIQGTGIDDGNKVRWISIIKADPDEALLKEVKAGKLSIRYASDLILGAHQRLLKVVQFTELAPASGDALASQEDFSIRLYDHLLSTSGRASSAFYFYSTFLGLAPADNAAKLCKVFYDKTREYTDSVSQDSGEKAAYRGHLVSYLRNQNEQISIKNFAETFLPEELRKNYREHLQKAKFPANAVRKDTRLIKSKLKRQSWKFSSKVLLVGVDDVLQKSVRIMGTTKIKGDEWTKLCIKGKLE